MHDGLKIYLVALAVWYFFVIIMMAAGVLSFESEDELTTMRERKRLKRIYKWFLLAPITWPFFAVRNIVRAVRSLFEKEEEE